jgi:hypothetical protein
VRPFRIVSVNLVRRRTLEQQSGVLIGFDPIIGGDNLVAQALADHAEEALLHMVTHDPLARQHTRCSPTPIISWRLLAMRPRVALRQRTRRVVSFKIETSSGTTAISRRSSIVRTWLGIVGPGVQQRGRIDELFTDHTDIRPTLLILANLKDDYAPRLWREALFQLLGHPRTNP